MTSARLPPERTTASAPMHAGVWSRCAWAGWGAMLLLTIGCTREVETGNPPIVITMANVVESSRPPSHRAKEVEATTAASPPVAKTQESPFDPASLVEGTSSHDQCVAALLPSAEEDRWLETAWRSDLLQARREANATGRPMFMWLMDGNPLGCT